jgi:hypothetical protein
MSEWTSLAAGVFQKRYDLTAWQVGAKAEDTYRAGAIMEARLGVILYPGQSATVEYPPGWFAENSAVGTQLHDRRSSRVLGCVSFRSIPQAFGLENLSVTNNDHYVDASRWFRKDWDLTTLVQAGMAPAYRDYLEIARRIWYKVLTTLEWIPNTIAVGVDRAINIGFLPSMVPTSAWQSAWGPLPSWLASPYRQAAWDALRNDLAVLNQDVSAASLALLANRAASLEASREFWDTIAKYTGVDAIASKWDELLAAVRRYNTAVRLGKDSLTRCRALLAANPGLYSAEQQAQVQYLAQQIDQDTAGARSIIPGSVSTALSQEGQSLGIAPVVAVGIGAAVVAGVTVVLLTWVSKAETTARQAMDMEQQLIMQAEQAANAAHAREQEAILARQRELDGLLDAGHITRVEYDQQMGVLQQRASVNNVALAQRRTQTKDLAAAHTANLDALRASQVSGGLMQIKGIAMWGALAAAVVVVGPGLMKLVD